MSSFDFDTSPTTQRITNLACMIDIETLGTTAGSPVITIGATLFDPYICDSSEELMRRSFLRRIDLKDAIDISDHLEGSTVRWWFEQKDEAIKALVGGDAVATKTALQDLYNYCQERGTLVNNAFFEGLSDWPKAGHFYAKDADFDMVLLRYYYEKLGLQMPWKFWETRSVRTVQDLAWPNGAVDRPSFEVPGGAHDARWDAVTQALTIQAAIRQLGLGRDQDVKFETWQGVQNEIK